MSSPKIEGWYYVSITLKSLIDGSTTKTVKLSNRPIIEEADGSTIYFPILKAIENIGGEVGDFVPAAHNGSITLDNSPHSLGFARKFSDLLERYTLAGQPIAIYSAQTTLDDVTINAEFSLDWTTTGLTWEIDGDDLRIDVAEQALSNKVITKVIDTVTFTTAPANSVGKYLPIIFGDSVPVKPVLIINGTGIVLDLHRRAYATNFGTNFINGGAVTIYVKSNSGATNGTNSTYSSVSSPSSVTTAFFAPSGAATGAVSLTSSYAFNIEGSGALLLGHECLITGGDFEIQGNNTAGTPAGIVTIELLESFTVTGGGASPPNEGNVIATAKVNKSSYTTQWQATAATTSVIPFGFDKPAKLVGSNTYWLAFKGSNETGASRTDMKITGSGTTYIKASTDATFYLSNAAAGARTNLYAAKFTDVPDAGTTDANGLGYSYIEISQNGGLGTAPSLQNLDIVVIANGITDDGSGTLTGSASARVRAPHHVIKALDLQWTGSAWTTTGAKIDQSHFSSSLSNHGETGTGVSTLALPRQIGGYSEGRKTAADLMAEICRNSAMKISRYNGSSQQFTLYAWGDTRTTVTTITDEDAKLLSVKALGAETIINRVAMNYWKDITFDDLLGAAGKRVDSYKYSTIYDIATSTLAATLSTTSVNLFGRNELAEENFNFISNNQTTYAQSVAEYFLRTFAFPFVYVELEVPLFKYKTLIEMLDVIEIVHPGLPAYFGSDSNADFPYYSGAVTELTSGQYWKRGKRYRAQIEGKVLNYNLGQFPTMRLSARLLLNTGADPT
jgi:hypothetical protein